MNNTTILSGIAVALFSCVIGFIGTLSLHWSIRPESQAAQDSIKAAEEQAFVQPSADMSILIDQNENIKASVSKLEDQFSKQVEIKNINESRAKILINDVQVFREERDRLFESLQSRKQKLVDKISELDQIISEKIETRNIQTQPLNDYEVSSELSNLLYYPHLLNDNEILNSALVESPRKNASFVQQRFELMLQATDYALNEKIDDILDDINSQLNDKNKNQTQTLGVHCTELGCEIQISMKRVNPYFDYWQQWLDELLVRELTKSINKAFSTETNETIIGSVLIDRL